MAKIIAILITLLFLPVALATDRHSMMEDIPTVSFCELVKKADSYFGKRVRLTATFMQATEGQYLIDETCDQMGIGPYANTKEKLGINYAGIDKASIDAINKSLKQIQSFADGHAIVEVIGTLRNLGNLYRSCTAILNSLHELSRYGPGPKRLRRSSAGLS